MSHCPKCNRDFKDDPMPLVTEVFIDGEYVTMCPLCYAADHLVRHGAPWNPVGEIAQIMYEVALEQHGLRKAKP